MIRQRVNRWCATRLVTIALVMAGCGQPRMVDVPVMPTFDHTFIRTIAVAEFANATRRPGAGRLMADRIEQLLVNESPYRVVSRMDLDRLLLEHNLGEAGLLDAATAQSLGRLSGADAILTGTVETMGVRQVTLRPESLDRGNPDRYELIASVVVTMKLIRTDNGQVLWSRTARGGDSATVERGDLRAGDEQRLLETGIQAVVNEARLIYPHTRRRLQFVRPE